MKIIKITFLQTFMFEESFMFKIHMQDPDNCNQSLEFLTHDSSEALDILLEYRKRIEKKIINGLLIMFLLYCQLTMCMKQWISF